jgi:hypothetical protein
MEGDLIQLRAKNYSGLDKYLSVSEDDIKTDKKFVSLYQSPFESYVKPSNFSVTTRKVGAVSNADFGQRASFIIPRYGDKINNIMLEVNLPTLSNVGYVNTIGHSMIEYVELEIGGQSIVKYTDIWLDVRDKLTTRSDYRAGINEMILRFAGHTDTSFTGGIVLVPLNFWFSDTLSQSFPLIALTHVDMVIHIKFKVFNSLWLSNSNLVPSGKYNIETCNLLVDYVRLDKFEREHLYNKKRHQFLIKQVQIVDYEINEGTQNFKASLDAIKYPVTELIWVFRNLSRLSEKDYYNYSHNDTTGNDIFNTASLSFGSVDRIEQMNAKYFRLYQPYNKHSTMPNGYIYSYSFAAKPENNTSPSGSCNFSEINDKTLNINLKTDMPSTNMYICAVNYNMLIIEDGYAWLEKCTG